MTRVEELAWRLADGVLSEAERSELEALVKDPAAARTAVGTLELEAALRAGRKGLDLGRAVVERIRREKAVRIERGVMDRIRADAPPSWLPGRRRSAAGWLCAAAAALFAAIVWFVVGPPRPMAYVSIHDPATGRREERALKAGGEVETAERGRAEIRYAGEDSVIEVEPLSRLVLERTGRQKRLVLLRGEISARVAPQRHGPLVIESPNARAEVLGTRLKLSAAEDATRLEVEEGRVRLVRAPDGASVEVPARHFSVAAVETKLLAEPMVPVSDIVPGVAGFSLIRTDAPRTAIPGYEALADGAVINLAKLPEKRINIQAHTDPPRVGSLRFSYAGDSNFNTELIWPYTLIPNNGTGKKTWAAAPGVHTITATPFTGSYGNGRAGTPRSLTIRVIDEE